MKEIVKDGVESSGRACAAAGGRDPPLSIEFILIEAALMPRGRARSTTKNEKQPRPAAAYNGSEVKPGPREVLISAAAHSQR